MNILVTHLNIGNTEQVHASHRLQEMMKDIPNRVFSNEAYEGKYLQFKIIFSKQDKKYHDKVVFVKNKLKINGQ